MTRLELVEGKSSKFWEVAVAGSAVTTRWGRIGTEGQSTTKSFGSADLARREADKLESQKLAKGYAKVGATGTGAKGTGAKGKGKGKLPASVAKATAKKREPASNGKKKTASDAGGVPKKVQKLAALAARVAQPGEPMTRIYVMVSSKEPPAPGDVSRAGGVPIGVSDKTRPRHGDDEDFMEHLLTIDLDQAPELRKLKALKKARAVALFISDAEDNEAFDDDTDETTVVVLSEAEIAKNGAWKGEKVAGPKARSLALYPVDVPTRGFSDDALLSEEKDKASRDLAALASELLSGDRVGGPLYSVSGDDHDGDLVAQFSEAIVDVNLGDAGTMYFFTDRAFWDCS